MLLREYADFDGELRDIYKLVSTLESAGVNIHRQMAIRVLGIPLSMISSHLIKLSDIINEFLDGRDEIQ